MHVTNTTAQIDIVLECSQLIFFHFKWEWEMGKLYYRPHIQQENNVIGRKIDKENPYLMWGKTKKQPL